MATAKPKKVLAAAIILQRKRCKKFSERRDNRKLWWKIWIYSWDDDCSRSTLHVMIYLPIWLVNFTGDSQWKGRKSQGRTDLANSGEFDRRYLTCQISAILYADRGDRCIKSPGVSPALGRPWRWTSLELFGESELAIPSGKIRCKVSCNSFSFWRRGWKCLGGRSHIFADRLLSTSVYLEVLFHFFFWSWIQVGLNVTGTTVP